MPVMLNSILQGAGLDLTQVRLIRHKDKRATKGRSPYELWRDQPDQFEAYQSSQNPSNRKKFSAPHWAVFIVDAFDETMFGGLYAAKYKGLLKKDRPKPHIEGEIDKAGSCDMYDLRLDDTLNDLIGRMFIDWGQGALAWVQYADRNDKIVTELRPHNAEDRFPGFLNFVEPLSRLPKLPTTWIATLQYAQGVYLLTCPKTKEQYIGSATGADGFWGRLMNYIQTGHGGNVGLKSRDPSDYQVSILEVAGTAANAADICAMEGRWQLKLQSREMGLNRNLARRQ